MSEWKIEDCIRNLLTEDTQKNALDFVDYLKVNEMTFERGKGYWENQFYWLIKYQKEYVCFILIDGKDSEEKFAPLTVWSDDSDSNWFTDSIPDEHIKKIAWEHVDFCENCGGDCRPGKHKIIFGKEFSNVCRTTMRFINPDFAEWECVKKMVEIRKNDILKKI